MEAMRSTRVRFPRVRLTGGPAKPTFTVKRLESVTPRSVRHGRESSAATRMESCPMRRLTAIMLPLSLALASGAMAASSTTTDPKPSTFKVAMPTIDRPEAPPETARSRAFTPDQIRRIADRVDRMPPRMRQAVLGRLAKMSDASDGDRRVRRAGPITRQADRNGDRRDLRDRKSRRGSAERSRSMSERSRRGIERSDAAAPIRGKADGRRDGRRVRPDHDRRDREDVRGVRMGKRSKGVQRQADKVRRTGDDGPRLRRAGDAAPEAATRKRSSPSERRRRD